MKTQSQSEFEPVSPYWAHEQMMQEREDRAFLCGGVLGVVLTVVAAIVFLAL